MRLDPEARKKQILLTAVELSVDEGYRNLTVSGTARRVQCTRGLVTHYFESVSGLRLAVLQYAMARRVMPILADVVTSGQYWHDVEMRRAVADYIRG